LLVVCSNRCSKTMHI